MNSTKVLSIILFLMLIPSISLAHLAGLEKIADGYRIEVGMIPESPKVGQSTEFSLSLENASINERFSSVEAWVRISSEDDVLFSSTSLVAKETETIKFSYNFQKAGDYELRVRFTTEEGKDIESDFPISVKNGQSSIYPFVGVSIGSLLIGLIIGYAIKTKKSRKKH